MKFLESHFEEYINAVEQFNLHPKLEKQYYSKFPKTIDKLRNLIFYGPSGVGKYSQMLYSIKKYSPSNLKYEKRLNITYDKKPYLFKISDIHYEIDMSLLGCNSKLLWHEIYQQMVDILSAKNEKTGIIVCKEFHHINSELLENFYSYMQDNNSTAINIKFILLTKDIGFIPNSIIHCCEIIYVARPSKTYYGKLIAETETETKTKTKTTETETKIKAKPNPKTFSMDIKNIKHLKTGVLTTPYKFICDKILKQMTETNEMKFLKFRELIYDLFIYNLDVNDCIWYILCELIQLDKIKQDNMGDVLLKYKHFAKYYNNNYRPIYHLESYLFYLTSVVNGYKIEPAVSP